MILTVRNISIVMVMLITVPVVGQQLPHLSQYMFNDFYINPAVAGTKDYNPAMLSIRTQWVGFSDAPTTQTMSYHSTMKEKMGIGGIIISDVTGPVRQTGFQLAYAYRIQVMENSHLSLGLGGMINQHVLDKSAIVLDDPNDNALVGGLEKKVTPEASFGAYLYGEKYYVGLSIPQLFQNKIDYSKSSDLLSSRLVRHYFLTAGYLFELNDNFKIEPSLLLKAVENAPFQWDLSSKVKYKDIIWLGVSYRDKEAVVIMLGASHKEYNIGYSYDITLTNIKKYSSGSHEFFMALHLPSRSSGKSSKAMTD